MNGNQPVESPDEKIARLQAEGNAQFEECQKDLQGRRGRPRFQSYVETKDEKKESPFTKCPAGASDLAQDEAEEPKPRRRRIASQANAAWPFPAKQGYISVARAAEFLTVSTKTIKRMIDDGDLRAVLISHNLYRVELPSLKEFLANASLGGGK